MAQTSTNSARDTQAASRGFFGRILLFIRQVIDEVRKTVRPTRDELYQYTLVVIIFLVVIMVYIIGLDQVFSRAVDWVFGSN